MYMRITTFLIAALWSPAIVMAQNSVLPLDSRHTAWKVAPQADMPHSEGDRISTAGFKLKNAIEGVVPGTVFTAYVTAGKEKDPNYGTNILEADEAFYNRPFWYRTEFRLQKGKAGERVWLCLDNTNRYADVWVNGQKVSGTKDSRRDISGHMLRSRFDITDVVAKNGRNAVAVLIYDADQKKSRHAKGDFANACSPTYLSAAGWDWMPYVPGRMAGITGDVRIEITGGISMSNTWVRTELPTLTHADLCVQTTLHNATGSARDVVLSGIIQPEDISFSKRITMTGADTTVTVTPDDCPSLSFDNPRLWWPNGYGEQNLYTCTLRAGDDDVRTTTFGIRRYEYAYIYNKVLQPVLYFYINGRRLLLKGGSWGMAEYMQRCDAAEYDKKVRLHKDLNYNMIRCWTGCVTDDAFYEACDRYGIMVWDDFWLHSGEGHPAEIEAFKANALDKVLRLRNHPCIALWCGANESRPLKEIDDFLRATVAREDGRLYKSSSNQDGLSGSSPWTNRPPRFHFETSLGGLILLNPPYPYGIDYGYGCRSEIGMATMPNYESVRLFIPEEDQWPLPEDKVLSEFNDNVWNHHFFGARGGNAGPLYYRDCIYDRYGVPHSLQEFCDKAQYVNLEDMKGIYEAWNDKMGNDASGALIWMSMSAFPSCVWQTFDYYYDTTGAYYAAKKACEPRHIQWNVVTDAIKVVNATNEDMNHFRAVASVYDFNGHEITALHKEKDISLRAADVTEAFRLDFPRRNVALGCHAVASSATERFPASCATDGLMSSRWESEYSDPQWIMIDLGQERCIETVRILWEGAYSASYEVQTSDDGDTWHTAYSNDNGKGGTDIITITPTEARYLRIMGKSRSTWFGHSIHEIEVFEPKTSDEHPVQFIKLELRDADGSLVSDNFYWRNSDIELDYTSLATLPEADITATVVSADAATGKAVVIVENHSATVAFGNRLRLVVSGTQERILPTTMSDNYFTLLPQEKKTVSIEAPAASLSRGATLLLKQYLYEEKVCVPALFGIILP